MNCVMGDGMGGNRRGRQEKYGGGGVYSGECGGREFSRIILWNTLPV